MIHRIMIPISAAIENRVKVCQGSLSAMPVPVRASGERGSLGRIIGEGRPKPRGSDSPPRLTPALEGETVEHVWLSHVTYDGERFHGRIDNNVESLRGWRLGDTVSVLPDSISDWLVIRRQYRGGWFLHTRAARSTE
jgi:hypothetical protein